MSPPLRLGPEGRVELLAGARVLRRDGAPLPVGARAFDVLLTLVDAGGELVTKERLLEQAWPGLVVEEANVHTQVSALRRLLGADAIATVPGLGYRFAWPLQAAGAAPAARHNLPAERTAFVGREAALADAEARLAAARLLTLTGIGGAGKTRLALRLAARVAAGWPDGVWWVDLAPLDGTDALAAAVAQTLGCAPRGGAAAVDALAAHLRTRRTLLVLDNAEHLLDAVAALADALLAAAPGLAVLVTSREAIGLDGETVLPVRPLAVPGPGADGAAVAAAEAARLFADRAALASPGFVLDDGNAAVVAEICRRVDGIPLAIELAAAQLRVLAPEQLLALLHERFGLLGGARRALPRQQTLQAVVRWSFDRLQPNEQRLLMALAVCGGGCDFDAAAALAPPGTARARLPALLARLAEQSLLHVEHGGDATRYQLLETVRQFAVERLHDGGDAAAVRDRHAAHYLALAERHDDEIEREGTGAASLARIDRERDNLLRALDAFDRADDAAAAACGLRLVTALRHYWPARGVLVLGRERTLAALARADGLPLDRTHALAFVSASQLLHWTGRRDESVALGERLLARARREGRDDGLAIAHGLLGQLLCQLGRLDDAEAHLERSRRLAEALGDERRLDNALGGLAALATRRGRLDEAARRYDDVLEIRRRVGHGYRLATALMNTASAALDRGDTARARTLLHEAATLLPRIGSRYLGQHLIDLAAFLCTRLARTAGDAPAVRLHAASAAQRRDIGLALDCSARAEQQRELAAARERLGDAEFDAAWAEGLALPYEAALALAGGLLAGP